MHLIWQFLYYVTVDSWYSAEISLYLLYYLYFSVHLLISESQPTLFFAEQTSLPFLQLCKSLSSLRRYSSALGIVKISLKLDALSAQTKMELRTIGARESWYLRFLLLLLIHIFAFSTFYNNSLSIVFPGDGTITVVKILMDYMTFSFTCRIRSSNCWSCTWMGLGAWLC